MIADARGDDRFHDLFATSETMEHFVIIVRGVLVSHADVTQRVLTHEGETYRLYGIGEVMTHPAFRREGHGSRVVEAATDYIRHSDADIGMLFTMPELEGFYGACGWTRLNRYGAYYGDANQSKFDDAFIMMLYLSGKAKTRRADFERGTLYVGETLW